MAKSTKNETKSEATAYCMKCKTAQPVKDVVIDTKNGKERIETTLQVDYTFGVGLKGYGWDEANGGKSPSNADLATGANWIKVSTNIKDTAGVLTIADATK